MKTETEKNNSPWHTKFWLLLAVLSNSNGSILIFTTFLHSPFSYIFTVIYIICYRFYFDIKKPDNMPIAIDLCFSLLSQTIVECKSWEFALLVVLFINLAVFQVCHVGTHVWSEFVRLKKLKTEGGTFIKDMKRPPNTELYREAVMGLYVFQGIFCVLIWVFPFGKWVYGFYQVFVGFFLAGQSVTFLKCYREMAKQRNRVSAAV